MPESSGAVLQPDSESTFRSEEVQRGVEDTKSTEAEWVLRLTGMSKGGPDLREGQRWMGREEGNTELWSQRDKYENECGTRGGRGRGVQALKAFLCGLVS